MITREDLLTALTNLNNTFPSIDVTQFASLVKKQLEKQKRFIQAHGGLKFSTLGNMLLALSAALKPAQAKVFDAWLRETLDKIKLDELRQGPGLSAILIEVAIKSGLKESAKYLIDNDIGLAAPFNTDSGEANYSALFYIVEHSFDKDLFDRLLAKEKDINRTGSFGQTALYLAIETGNQYAIGKILQRGDVEVKGRFFQTTIFDLVKHDATLYKKLVEKVNETFKAENYDWSELITFPISELGPEQQDILYHKLLKKIDELEVFKNNPLLRDAFLDFINNPKPLHFKRLNRLAIAFECVSYLVNVAWVNQHKTNLCGPNVLMQQVIFYQPQVFIHTVMELAELGSNSKQNHYLPARVNSITKENLETNYNLASVWMEAIRHSYNTFTGYSAKSKLESFYGLTTPYQLELMFTEFNCSIAQENIQVKFHPELRLGWFLEGARKTISPYGFLLGPFKIYGSKHKEVHDDAQRFDELLKWAEHHPNKMIVILVDSNLLQGMVKNVDQQSQSFIFVEYSHYINLNKITLSANQQTLLLDFSTFGLSFSNIEVGVDFFKKGYRGGLLVIPPTVEATLETSPSKYTPQ